MVWWWWKVIIVSALSLRDKDRFRDWEIEKAWQQATVPWSYPWVHQTQGVSNVNKVDYLYFVSFHSLKSFLIHLTAQQNKLSMWLRKQAMQIKWFGLKNCSIDKMRRKCLLHPLLSLTRLIMTPLIIRIFGLEIKHLISKFYYIK